jgi:hypothetical protein
VQLPQRSRDALANIVRHRFRVPRPQRLGLAKAFRAGYAAIDRLDGAVAGDESCLQRVRELLERTPDSLKRPIPAREPTKKKCTDPDEQGLKQTRTSTEIPPLFKFVNMFPRKEVRGRRRVPYMVNANGVPFVRWKKPQPERVSLMIRNLIRLRVKRWGQFHRLENYHIPLAQREDEWERTLSKGTNVNKNIERQPSFGSTLAGVRGVVVSKLADMAAKKAAWTKKFDGIIMEEQRLKDEEDAARFRKQEEKIASSKWASQE